MHEQERHEMFLERIYPSGVEEWHCSTCERCLLIRWKPKFMIITREADDQYFMHEISKDGLQVESTRIKSISDLVQPEEPGAFSEEARLAPWLAWMDAIDFENLWDDEV